MLEELEDWNTLPWEGGFMQQPYSLMLDLRATRNARQQWYNSRVNAAKFQSGIAAVGRQARSMAGQ